MPPSAIWRPGLLLVLLSATGCPPPGTAPPPAGPPGSPGSGLSQPAGGSPTVPITTRPFDPTAPLALPGPITFEMGKAVLKLESDAPLTVASDTLMAHPEITLLRIEGHTNSDGVPAGNQTLSEARAMSVARWLISKGISCKRLIPVGFGQDRPIASNRTPEGRAQNERVVLVPAAISGAPVGGQPEGGGGRVAGDPCR